MSQALRRESTGCPGLILERIAKAMSIQIGLQGWIWVRSISSGVNTSCPALPWQPASSGDTRRGVAGGGGGPSQLHRPEDELPGLHEPPDPHMLVERKESKATCRRGAIQSKGVDARHLGVSLSIVFPGRITTWTLSSLAGGWAWREED